MGPSGNCKEGSILVNAEHFLNGLAMSSLSLFPIV